MASEKYEKRSILESLETFLEARGWSSLTYNDGFQADEPIERPTVAITYAPSKIEEIQLGRDDEKLYVRTVVLNAYMSTEGQASDIAGDLMEFMDLECVTITDQMTNATLGTIQTTDTNTIRSQIFPPIMNMPKVLQWRAACQGVYKAWYF